MVGQPDNLDGTDACAVEAGAPQNNPAGGIRRRTVLASALGVAPVIMAGRAGALAGPEAAASEGAGSEGAGSEAASAARLTIEHRVDPLGVDATQPRFGWRLASSTRGQQQSAYQILVAESPERLTPGEADVWDSGRVDSSGSVAVAYDGPALRPSTRYYCTALVWDIDGRIVVDSPTAFFETGLMSTDGVTEWDDARWIGMAGKQPNSPGAPMLRRQVALDGEVAEARLYVSALGVYDAYVNGERVGVPEGDGTTYELLPPGWTNYDTTINYMTYDVTGLIAGERDVTLAAVLGKGWYSGRMIAGGSTYFSEDGNPLALKAKLLIRYADGSTQSIVTAPGADWKATDAGPYRFDDIYDGQTYDARQQLPGWNDNGFDDSAWSGTEEHGFTTQFPDSKLIAYPGETARLMPEWDRSPHSIVVYTGVAGEDESPNGKGHIVVDESRSVTDPDEAAEASVSITTGDTAIFDLGQNVVGVYRFTVQGPAGAEVTLKFAEMLNDDSEGADGPEGSVYRANLRSAKATSTYVLAGDAAGETHQDTLTFYGYRYVSVAVTSPDATVTVDGLTGMVATSAIRDIGDIVTDDNLVNQLFSNARWGQRGNYVWIPTDCPQRDERLGWTGDTQVFASTGLYNGDAVNFLSHYMHSTVESAATYGAGGAQYQVTVPPAQAINGASGWSDAGVVVPWTIWQMSGDPTIIEDNWDAMVRYMDWMFDQTGEEYRGPGTWTGDWLSFQGTANQLMSDVYYGYSAKLMIDMARATGRDAAAQTYETLVDDIRAAYLANWMATDPDTGKAIVTSGQGESSSAPAEDNSQTALLWTLKLGFYADETQHHDLVDALVANIENSPAYKEAHPDSSRVDYAENTLSVGFLGVNVLAPVLTEEGRADLAYALLHQDAMPSWLYSVRNGATTIWERWNSYSIEDGFGPVSMNSFNHYAYGAIVEWMYEHVAGIAKDPENPGFKHFFLQPKLDPTGRITHVDGSYESPAGEIVSQWQLRGQRMTYRVVVPANTTATLHMPAASPGTVLDGGRRLIRAPGVEFLGFDGGVASFRLPAGGYDLSSTVG